VLVKNEEKIMKERCDINITPVCNRVSPDNKTDPVSCCAGNFGGVMNWRCAGSSWEHLFSGPHADKYSGITHDEICKDIGLLIFNERTWSGDKSKPLGELRKSIIAARPARRL
jgi:hypothetical protein